MSPDRDHTGAASRGHAPGEGPGGPRPGEAARTGRGPAWRGQPPDDHDSGVARPGRNGTQAHRVPTARLAWLLAGVSVLLLVEGAMLSASLRGAVAALTLGATLLAALADAASTASPHELECARLVRGPLCFGRPACVEVAFRWQPVRVRTGWGVAAARRFWWADLPPPGWTAAAPQGRGRLAPGAPLAAAYEVLPRARGRVRWEGPRLTLDSPLGLWALAVSAGAAEEHTVVPGGLPQGLLPGRREQAGAPAAGDWGVEPDGIRPYLSGEDARRISWRASARRDEPLVARLRPERGQRVLLAVDAGRWSSVAVAGQPVPTTRLDAFCAAALQVAGTALAAGDAVGLALLRDSGPVVRAPRGGAAALPGLAHILALAVPGEYDVDGARAAAAMHEAGADLILCFSEAPSPEEAPPLFRYLPRLGRLTRIGYCSLCPAELFSLVSAPADSEGDERIAAVRLAAVEMLRGRRQVLRELARSGITARDAIGDALGTESVAVYRRLARGAATL